MTSATLEALISFGVSPIKAEKGAVISNFPKVFAPKFRGSFRTFLFRTYTNSLLTTIDSPAEQLLVAIRAWLAELANKDQDPYLSIAPPAKFKADPTAKVSQAATLPIRKTLVDSVTKFKVLDGFRIEKSDLKLLPVKYKQGSAQGFILTGTLTLSATSALDASIKKTKFDFKGKTSVVLCTTPNLKVEVLKAKGRILLAFTALVDCPIKTDKSIFELAYWIKLNVWWALCLKHPLPNCRILA